MSKHNKVSLIIPVRNEENSVSKMLKKVPDLVGEVLVVDNNSADKTAAIARKHGARVLKEPKRDRFGIGYGYAHQKGIRQAKGDLIVAMDGDDTYPLEEIKDVIKFMEKNSLDFVSCRRFPLKKKAVISKVRQFGVWLLNFETRVLYRYPIKDILSGMWVMNKNAKAKLNLREGGWNLSPEIKLNAILNKDIKFAEYHIDHHYRLDEKSKQKIFQTGFNHFVYIFAKWFKVDSSVAKTYKEIAKSISGLAKRRLPRIAFR